MNGVYIKERLMDMGASIVGFADFRFLDSRPFSDLPFAVSIGVAIDPSIVAGLENGPNESYCEEYLRLNNLLDDLSVKLVHVLEVNGYSARAFLASDKNFLKDKLLTASFSHKMAATRSGVGWIGKNDLLITKEFGSAIRLTTVFTDMFLEAGEPFNRSLCGKCRNCIEACPASAPKDVLWTSHMNREDLINIEACYDKVRELSSGLSCSTICGICISVCPWTKKYLKKVVV